MVTVLMVGHWVALPSPTLDDGDLANGLSELPTTSRSTWLITHVLYEDCRCSQRVFQYLEKRPTPEAARERILLVGEKNSWEGRARERGFQIVHVTQEELEDDFGIVSAPLLVISDPHAQVKYAGGYTDRRQGLDYRDTAILEEVREGRTPKPLPVYGCGVSPRMQQVLDPIGIKYAN